MKTIFMEPAGGTLVGHRCPPGCASRTGDAPFYCCVTWQRLSGIVPLLAGSKLN